MPVLEEAVSPKPSARDELREYRRRPTGLVRRRKHEMRPDIQNTESDEELERMMARPESQFIGHSLKDEAEMGYLGPEDNILALPDGSKIESTGPPLTRIISDSHNEQQFQQRKNAIFAAIDKLEAERTSSSKSNFCLVGKIPRTRSVEMDIDAKEGEFEIPKPRFGRRKTQNRRLRPMLGQRKAKVADHIAHPENYTKYSLDWGRREQAGEQALAVKQMQEVLREKKDKGLAEGRGEHEAAPQSIGSLAAMAKSIISSESGSRHERMGKRRAHKKLGKRLISSKEIKKQTCSLSFDDD